MGDDYWCTAATTSSECLTSGCKSQSTQCQAVFFPCYLITCFFFPNEALKNVYFMIAIENYIHEFICTWIRVLVTVSSMLSCTIHLYILTLLAFPFFFIVLLSMILLQMYMIAIGNWSWGKIVHILFSLYFKIHKAIHLSLLQIQ